MITTEIQHILSECNATGERQEDIKWKKGQSKSIGSLFDTSIITEGEHWVERSSTKI